MSTNGVPALLSLPLEIRLQVYRACMPDALRVDLCHDRAKGSPLSERADLSCPMIVASRGRLPNPMLPLQQTCQAMNAELLAYKPCLLPVKSVALTCCSPSCLSVYLKQASDATVSRVETIRTSLPMDLWQANTVFGSVHIQIQLKEVIERLNAAFASESNLCGSDAGSETTRCIRGSWRRSDYKQSSAGGHRAGEEKVEEKVLVLLALTITKSGESSTDLGTDDGSISSCCSGNDKQAGVIEWQPYRPSHLGGSMQTHAA